jgi:type II secretory pathway pseudopilin PulG
MMCIFRDRSEGRSLSCEWNSREAFKQVNSTDPVRAIKNLQRKQRNRTAFTFLEVVAVTAVVALMTMLWSVSLARTQRGSAATQCQANLKHLITAWQMYAEDSSGRLVPMYHGGAAQGGNFDPHTGPPWCEGWLDWTTLPDNTNLLFLVNPRYARLADYLGRNPRVFQCPADSYLSPAQRSWGWTRRARNYSGNIGIGLGNAEAGPWDPLYRHVTNIVDLVYPAPSGTWVFIEEHPDSMNDPAFFSPYRTSFIDAPAAFHHGACGFAFADGHADLHRWVASASSSKAAAVGFLNGSYLNSLAVKPGDADLHWLSFHSQRRSTNSF